MSDYDSDSSIEMSGGRARTRVRRVRRTRSTSATRRRSTSGTRRRSSSGTRRTTKRNPYQSFMSKTLKSLRREATRMGRNPKQTELMKKAARLWRQKKRY